MQLYIYIYTIIKIVILKKCILILVIIHLFYGIIIITFILSWFEQRGDGRTIKFIFG